MPGFKEARWWEVNKWNFEDECPLMSENEINGVFDNREFFEIIEFMPLSSMNTLKLAKKYDIYICSIGTTINLAYKKEWLSKYMRYIKGFIGVDLNKYNDKSHIDMSNSIFIDDNSRNLITCNAVHKICFGDVCSWNEDWDGERCYNWHEVLMRLQ